MQIFQWWIWEKILNYHKFLKLNWFLNLYIAILRINNQLLQTERSWLNLMKNLLEFIR